MQEPVDHAPIDSLAAAAAAAAADDDESAAAAIMVCEASEAAQTDGDEALTAPLVAPGSEAAAPYQHRTGACELCCALQPTQAPLYPKILMTIHPHNHVEQRHPRVPGTHRSDACAARRTGHAGAAQCAGATGACGRCGGA